MAKEDQVITKGISDIAGCFTDCLVLPPGGWHDTLPEDLLQAISMDRLIELMVANKEKREPTATNAECVAYLYCFSLVGPPDHDTTQIYLYCSTQYMRTHKKVEVPEDIRVDELTSYQQMLLRDMKRDIYRVRVGRRTEERKAEKREAKEAEKAKQPVVVQERLF